MLRVGLVEAKAWPRGSSASWASRADLVLLLCGIYFGLMLMEYGGDYFGGGCASNWCALRRVARQQHRVGDLAPVPPSYLPLGHQFRWLAAQRCSPRGLGPIAFLALVR
ncbi:MAG: hypothetical protein R3B46_02310 [Phycisphaerales bacterium]